MTLCRFLLLISLVAFLPVHADILANGNFADGRAHWRGDIREAEEGLQPPCIYVDLKRDKWCKIYQTFPSRNTKLYYRIIFQLSSDYKMARNDASAAMSYADLSEVPGARGDMQFIDCFWGLAVFGSDDAPFGQGGGLTINATKFDIQTIAGSFSTPTDSDATMVLLFPPGQGSVQLFSISLSPDPPPK